MIWGETLQKCKLLFPYLDVNGSFSFNPFNLRWIMYKHIYVPIYTTTTLLFNSVINKRNIWPTELFCFSPFIFSFIPWHLYKSNLNWIESYNNRRIKNEMDKTSRSRWQLNLLSQVNVSFPRLLFLLRGWFTCIRFGL